MTLDVGPCEAFRLRYSYERFQWLIAAISGLSILTFSSEELWLGYQVNLPAFYLYVIFFISTIFYANARDFQKICGRTIVVVFCALISVVADLALLSLSGLVTLLLINQLSTNLLRSFSSILLIVLPFSLGEVALSSLTIEYLRKRADKLRTEITKLKREIPALVKQREEGEKALQELEKKKAELEKLFSKEKSESGETDE